MRSLTRFLIMKTSFAWAENVRRLAFRSPLPLLAVRLLLVPLLGYLKKTLSIWSNRNGLHGAAA